MQLRDPQERLFVRKKVRISFFHAFIFECKKGRFIKSAAEGGGAAGVIKRTFFAREDK
jgi:hypothetical protein